MQYSRITLVNRPMIIDKKEGLLLNNFLKTKSMTPLQEACGEITHKYLVFGAALHNEGCEKINHEMGIGSAFAYSQTEDFNTLTIQGLHLTSSLVSGGLTFTPFAALVESHIELNPDTEECISAFLRNEEMDIITNLLNRECIYAMKEFKKLDENTRNWRSGINDERLLEIAFGIN